MAQMDGNEAMSPPRVPPRQQVTRKFPVVGERAPTPEALDVRQWRLRITGQVQHDIHCVTRWSRLDCRWRGVAFTTLAALVSPAPPARFVQFIAYSQRQH